MISLLRSVRRGLVVPCVLCAWPAPGQELRLSHQFHDSRDARGRAAQVFASEAARRSPEVKFRVYPELSLGLSRDEQLEALQSGTLDFAVLPVVAISKKVPEFSLAMLPGLVPNLAAARALKGSEVHSKLQEIAAANGLRIVTWWWMRGGFATTPRSVDTPASVAGLNLQSCGLMQNLLAHAGARTSEQPANEIPMLLEMGALDGVAIPYEELVGLKLHEQAKFATFGGPSLVTCFSPMLMSKKTWERLTPSQKQSIEEAGAVSDAYFEAAQVATEERALAAFREAGASLHTLTDDEYLSWMQRAHASAWNGYATTSPQARELVDSAIKVTTALKAYAPAGSTSPWGQECAAPAKGRAQATPPVRSPISPDCNEIGAR